MSLSTYYSVFIKISQLRLPQEKGSVRIKPLENQSTFGNKQYRMPIHRPRAQSTDDARGQARQRQPFPSQRGDDKPQKQDPSYTNICHPVAAESVFHLGPHIVVDGKGAHFRGLTQLGAGGGARMIHDVQNHETTMESPDSSPVLQEDRLLLEARRRYNVYRNELMSIVGFFSFGKTRMGQVDANNLVPINLESLSQQLRVSPSPGLIRHSSAEPHLPESREASISTAMGKRSLENIRLCHNFIALGILTIGGRLAPALWRSTIRNDLSGGFSLAQYILGVGIFVIGSIIIIHSKTCTCWQ